ncbi:MAG: DUF4871 domain-containing protein [Paenibacillaceae bacterium]|nr:DUF4871 domain-containing protein [Paenibacillaceae bacterium]
MDRENKERLQNRADSRVPGEERDWPPPQPAWYAELAAPPVQGAGFTPKLAERIAGAAKRPPAGKRAKTRIVWAALIAAVLLPLALQLPTVGNKTSPHLRSGQPFRTAPGDLELQRQVYERDGRKMLTVLPGGNATAGQQEGSWWIFEQPPEQMAGRHLRVEATQERTGSKMTLLADVVIGESDPAYPSVTKVATPFGLPAEGPWKLDIYLDDEWFGDVVIVAGPAGWEPSPHFQLGLLQMSGIKDKLAFVDAGFIAGKANKYMWHLWGNPESLQGPFRVVAVKQGSEQLIDVFRAEAIGGAVNGADASVVSSMKLPSAGRWRLTAYAAERLIGSIVVDVAEQSH